MRGPSAVFSASTRQRRRTPGPRPDAREGRAHAAREGPMSASAVAPIADVAARAIDGAPTATRRRARHVRPHRAHVRPTEPPPVGAGIDVAWRQRAFAALGGAPRGPIARPLRRDAGPHRAPRHARPHERLVAADFPSRCSSGARQGAARRDRRRRRAGAAVRGRGAGSAVVCGFGIRNVADPEKAIREVRRVLVPGGVFVALEFFRPTRLVTRVFHRAYARCVLPGGRRHRLGRPRRVRLSRQQHGRLPLARGIRAAAVAGGFARVRGEDLTLGVASIVRAGG